MLYFFARAFRRQGDGKLLIIFKIPCHLLYQSGFKVAIDWLATRAAKEKSKNAIKKLLLAQVTDLPSKN